MDNPSDGIKETSFYQKVYFTVAVVAAATISILLITQAIEVFLLILSACLIAVYFHGLADLIRRKTKWSKKTALAISITGSSLLIGGLFYLIGARVAAEGKTLVQEMPAFLDNARQYIERSEVLQPLYKRMTSSENMEKLQPILTKFFSSSFGFLGDIYLILFIGIFFTATPGLYKQGAVRLLPAKARSKGKELLEKISGNLTSWLKGMLFSMLIVFILTAIGLVILDIKMWLVLALIAGLLSFIPNFGPLLSIIPALLIGLSQSPNTAIWVVVLYGLVQLLESNFITPFIQQELIKTPPALIIIVQVFMGIWLGGWGVILATPILVVIMVIIHELYIKKQDALAKKQTS